jgi:hypothetical protein
MAETGVHTIAYAFPKVSLITTAVDPHINERYENDVTTLLILNLIILNILSKY